MHIEQQNYTMNLVNAMRSICVKPFEIKHSTIIRIEHKEEPIYIEKCISVKRMTCKQIVESYREMQDAGFRDQETGAYEDDEDFLISVRSLTLSDDLYSIDELGDRFFTFHSLNSSKKDIIYVSDIKNINKGY